MILNAIIHRASDEQTRTFLIGMRTSRPAWIVSQNMLSMSSQLSKEVNRLGQSILLKNLPISALRLARISRLNTYFVERLLTRFLGCAAMVLGILSTRVFETRTATGRDQFAFQDSCVSQIFIRIISNGEKKLDNEMWLCEDKLKGKTGHFRLPSASQKRACLSSLLWSERPNGGK